MKTFLHILFLFILIQPVIGQNEVPGENKIREKMIEYIQNRLGLTRAEAEKCQPIFMNYFRELKQTNKEYKDRGGLEFQQKILEVRLRYRDQFKPILGEKRSNEVFDHEKEFVKTLREEINQRRQERLEGRANKRKNTELLPNQN